MPPSTLDRLASLHIDYPMLFELRNNAVSRTSHCGVLEFIAEEGMIYMTYWVLFTGEKIGVGMGKTRKDAQQQATENALRSLADKYVEYVGYTSGTDEKKFDMHSIRKENGFIWDDVNTKPRNTLTDEKLPKESKSEVVNSRFFS